jgi:hypothetical protein
MEIHFLGILAEKAGYRHRHVVLERPARLRDLLPPLADEDVLIMIDGRVGTLESLVEDGGTVTIMPMLSGG